MVSSEEALRPGMRVEHALEQFRTQVNPSRDDVQHGPLALPKLQNLQTLLTDPITANQAQGA
jgi:hypothetical protein